MTAFVVLVYGLSLWLGLYLIGRDPRSHRLLLTGLGLVVYALALAGDLLADAATSWLEPALARIQWLLALVPALLWTGALIQLLPEQAPRRSTLWRLWLTLLLPVIALLLLVSFRTNLVVSGSGAVGDGVARFALGCVVLLPLLGLVALAWRDARSEHTRQVTGILIVVTLFFTLSTGLQLFPMGWLPRLWTLLALGCDVICLGVTIAYFDAFDQGEALLPDMLRSFVAAILSALIFGGQTVLIMGRETGPTLPLLGLLLTGIASAIAIPTFANAIGGALDALALRGRPAVRSARADFRAASSALPRSNPTLDPTALDDAAFTRLTRRALSHFGDLPRLAASPLIHLPIVEQRLAARSAADNTLERAVELKSLLAESIERLKPRGRGEFGTSDEWRHYNALYFPYVVGLKPYGRRSSRRQADALTSQALAWFHTAVPERTLYNWQNAAAALVAQDLRSRNAERV